MCGRRLRQKERESFGNACEGSSFASYKSLTWFYAILLLFCLGFRLFSSSDIFVFSDVSAFNNIQHSHWFHSTYTRFVWPIWRTFADECINDAFESFSLLVCIERRIIYRFRIQSLSFSFVSEGEEMETKPEKSHAMQKGQMMIWHIQSNIKRNRVV